AAPAAATRPPTAAPRARAGAEGEAARARLPAVELHRGVGDDVAVNREAHARRLEDQAQVVPTVVGDIDPGTHVVRRVPGHVRREATVAGLREKLPVCR